MLCCFLSPLSPSISIYILLTVVSIVPLVLYYWENSLINQDTASLVIIVSIFLTCMFDEVVIL